MGVSEVDRENIAALIVDEKYQSLLKLEQNICAQWIQQCMYEEGEQKELKKGGVKMYTTIHKAIENAFKQKMQNGAEQQQMDKTLNGLGW